MKTALPWVAYIFAWYLVGFLSVCIGAFFDGPVSHERWLKNRMLHYNLAFLGPLVTFGLIVYLLIFIIKMIGALLNIRKIFPLVGRISDWMIAGFRKPPVLLVAKDNDSSEFPTVSP